MANHAALAIYFVNLKLYYIYIYRIYRMCLNTDYVVHVLFKTVSSSDKCSFPDLSRVHTADADAAY